MKIKYLGTAAAEGIPALFCECEICKRAKITKGKNVRSRSQVLVNDNLLIDYPPDSFYHFVNNDIDLSKINNLIISHAHEDHFYPLDFEYFFEGFSVPKKCLPFTVYGSTDLKPYLDSYVNSPRNQGLKYMPIEPYKTYTVGKYMVTPLEASHGTEHPYVYIVSDGEKEFFYCHDSGLLKDEVFDYLNSSKHHFDLVSIDCTVGDAEMPWNNHMNLEMNKKTIDRLKQVGVVDENTKVVVSHFSHNGGHVLYEDMVQVAATYGFDVSYDGMEIEF